MADGASDTVAGRFLSELAEVGRDPSGGWSRLGLSPAERQAHRLFQRWAQDLGVHLATDPVGNSCAELSDQRRSLGVRAELLSDQSSVQLQQTVQDRLVDAAERCGTRCLVMASGAGHDAAHIARVAPTGMLFVPSREGSSHVPEEWSDVADISAGARVLAEAVLDLDRLDAV